MENIDRIYPSPEIAKSRRENEMHMSQVRKNNYLWEAGRKWLQPVIVLFRGLDRVAHSGKQRSQRTFGSRDEVESPEGQRQPVSTETWKRELWGALKDIQQTADPGVQIKGVVHKATEITTSRAFTGARDSTYSYLSNWKAAIMRYRGEYPRHPCGRCGNYRGLDTASPINVEIKTSQDPCS